MSVRIGVYKYKLFKYLESKVLLRSRTVCFKIDSNIYCVIYYYTIISNNFLNTYIYRHTYAHTTLCFNIAVCYLVFPVTLSTTAEIFYHICFLLGKKIAKTNEQFLILIYVKI